MKQTVFILGLLLGVRATAEAQDVGQVGLSIEYPASIAVIWHVSDAIAIRPEVAFVTSSADTGQFSSDFTTVTAGVSGLFYVRRWDNLRAYVSPRFSYGRNSSNSSSGLSIIQSSSNYTATGSFGAQYNLHKKFAVFGETGIAYSHLKSSSSAALAGGLSSPIATPDTSSSSVSTRSGVGVVFYFK